MDEEMDAEKNFCAVPCGRGLLLSAAGGSGADFLIRYGWGCAFCAVVNGAAGRLQLGPG